MKIMDLTDVDWKTDQRIIEATRRERELYDKQLALRKERDAAWAEGCANSEGISRQPVPWHPAWRLHGEFEAADQAYRRAVREREQAEELVRREVQHLGYQAGRRYYEKEILPLLHQMQDKLRGYEILMDEVYAKTGARLEGLGVGLNAAAIDETLRNIETRNVFGDATVARLH